MKTFINEFNQFKIICRKTENWPAKLQMQVIQKTAMTNVISQFTKDSKTVFFYPTSNEGMECFLQGANVSYPELPIKLNCI